MKNFWLEVKQRLLIEVCHDVSKRGDGVLDPLARYTRSPPQDAIIPSFILTQINIELCKHETDSTTNAL